MTGGWRPQRTAVGLVLGALALFGVGTNVQAGWLIALAALLLGAAVAGAILPQRAIAGITVRREAPDVAFSGAEVPVRLIVTNGARSARGLVLLQDDYLGPGTAVITRLHPGQTRTFEGLRTGARRGLHVSGPCEVVSGAPFGVALARRTVRLPSRTVVYPRVHPVSLGEHGSRPSGEPATRPRRAPSGDTSSVREYRPGDQLRHVHWRSSARQGRLVVREFEEDARADVVVVADTTADGDTLDGVASAACSYALAALDLGRGVRLVAGGLADRDAIGRTEVLEWGAQLVHHRDPPRLPEPGTYAIVVATWSGGRLPSRPDAITVTADLQEPWAS